MSGQRRPINRKPVKRAARPSLLMRGLALAGHCGKAAGLAVARRPTLSAGLAAFAVLFGGVAGNALYGQHARHPNPMLATRKGPETLSVARADPASALMPVPLVREVQEALAEGGYYTAAVDGRPGPATAEAIRAFQSARGLPVDGTASPRLLSQLRGRASAAPSPAPRPDPRQTASLDERMGAMTASVADDSTGEAEPRKVAERFASLDQDEIVRRIQTALTNAQVAELTADGIPGEKTRAAIRTFQALEGMEVTGEPDAELLEHLAEVGIVH